MSPESLSGLPPLLQYLIFGGAGLCIIIATAISYFKGVAREKSGTTGMVLAGDAKTIELLVAAVDRNTAAIDRHDDSLQRATDAVRDSTEASHKVRNALLADKAMPPNEELLMLLKRIEERLPRRDSRE